MRLRENLDRQIANQVGGRRKKHKHVVKSTHDPDVFKVRINKKDIKRFQPSAIKGLRILNEAERGQDVLFIVNYNPNGGRENGRRRP